MINASKVFVSKLQLQNGRRKQQQQGMCMFSKHQVIECQKLILLLYGSLQKRVHHTFKAFMPLYINTQHWNKFGERAFKKYVNRVQSKFNSVILLRLIPDLMKAMLLNSLVLRDILYLTILNDIVQIFTSFTKKMPDLMDQCNAKLATFLSQREENIDITNSEATINQVLMRAAPLRILLDSNSNCSQSDPPFVKYDLLAVCMLLLLSDKYQWSDISPVIFGKLVSRNIQWIYKIRPSAVINGLTSDFSSLSCVIMKYCFLLL